MLFLLGSGDAKSPNKSVEIKHKGFLERGQSDLLRTSLRVNMVCRNKDDESVDLPLQEYNDMSFESVEAARRGSSGLGEGDLDRGHTVPKVHMMIFLFQSENDMHCLMFWRINMNTLPVLHLRFPKRTGTSVGNPVWT